MAQPQMVFRSLVIAQFTGVSLQNDYSTWEQYDEGTDTWGNVSNFTAFEAASPNNLRMKRLQRSFHIRAVNDAVIQLVSVFAIGQGVHHWAQSGGELTITNSNSNWGLVAGLAEGYQDVSYPQDTGFTVYGVKVPLDLSEKSNKTNIKKTFFAQTDSFASNTLTLTENLTGETDNEPDELGDYTLRPGSKLWLELGSFPDALATLAAGTTWDASSNQNQIVLTGQPQVTIDGTQYNLGATLPDGRTLPNFSDNLRVYIRRLTDTRTVEERSYSLLVNKPSDKRLPQRNYTLQTPTGVSDVSDMTGVLRAGTSGITNVSEVELKQLAPTDRAFSAGRYYRPGDSLIVQDKHWACVQKTIAPASITDAWLTANFEQNFVHMDSNEFAPEDYFKNVQPQIIFDNDTDNAEDSTLLGWILDGTAANNCWTGTPGTSNTNQINAGLVQPQFESATDYRGLVQACASFNINGGTVPAPQNSNQVITEGASISMEFRRPSTIRAFSHSYEWAGFTNYSKAVPKYQKGMTGANKFTYYATSADGGRVYFTGMNEEGFAVSPRGVEDIQTGEVAAPEQIGAPDQPLNFPTEFENINVSQNLTVGGDLTVGGTTTVGDIVITGNITGLEDIAKAKTDVFGVSQIASIAELDAGAIATSDDALNTAGPRFVTPEGLEYWKVQNSIVSSTPGTRLIYVDPVNGADITNINDLLENPPENSGAAVKTLRAAVNYGNTVYGSTQTVEYRIGPGVYLEAGIITFETIAFIRAWDYGSQTYLNDSTKGGTKPFMGVTSNGKAWNQNSSYFMDPTNHPVFLTNAKVSFPYAGQRGSLDLDPLSLVFNYDARVTGVVWWGSQQTIVSTDVPDSFFTSVVGTAAWRANAQADPDNALNIMIKAELDKHLADGNAWVTTQGLTYIQGLIALSFEGESLVNNIAIGALSPVNANQLSPSRISIAIASTAKN